MARELPKDKPIRIVVHLPEAEATKHQASELQGALTRYFDYRAAVVALDINELFRVGRMSLAIGLTVLALCLATSQALGPLWAGPYHSVYRGKSDHRWLVANWKPIEIFLYDWWPISRRRDLYRRLAAATVELKPYAADDAP